MGYVDSTGKHGEIKETPPEKQEMPVKAKQGGEVNFGLTQEEIDLIPLRHYFGIETGDSRSDDKLRFIIDWAKKRGIKSRGDLFAELKKYEMRLGEPNLGETREGRLYRYLRLDQQISDLFKEMEAYERKS